MYFQTIDRNYTKQRKVGIPAPYGIENKVRDPRVNHMSRTEAQRYVQSRLGTRLSRLFEEHNLSESGLCLQRNDLQSYRNDWGHGLWLDHILMSRGTPVRGRQDHLGRYAVKLPDGFVKSGEAKRNLLLNGSRLHREDGVNIWVPGEAIPLNFEFEGEGCYIPAHLNPRTGFINRPYGCLGFRIRFNPGLRAVSLDEKGRVDATQSFTTPYECTEERVRQYGVQEYLRPFERHYIRLVIGGEILCRGEKKTG